MKKYCPECGFANEYNLDEAPLNCSKCKKSMSFVIEPISTSKLKSINTPKESYSGQNLKQRVIKSNNTENGENDEEYEDESEITDYKLNHQSVSISINKNPSYSLTELANSQRTGETREKKSSKNNSILKDIQKIMETKSVDIE